MENEKKNLNQPPADRAIKSGEPTTRRATTEDIHQPPADRAIKSGEPTTRRATTEDILRKREWKPKLA